MSNVKLVPRLNDVGVTRCMEDLDRLEEREAERMDVGRRLTEYEPWIWCAPSGGSLSDELVREIHARVLDIAARHGYPRKASDACKVAFDVDVAKWFAENSAMGSPEFLRDDIWSFLSCVMLQEVVIWRYSARQRPRLAGGVRNTFQRLWMRGRTLDLGVSVGEGRWRLLEGLSEDAMVQIFERASIASDAVMSRAIATGWLDCAGRIGRGRMEDVMRRAMKLLRLRNQIVDLSYLPPEDLAMEVERAFTRSSKTIPSETAGSEPPDDLADHAGDA
uniref:hypothetical protein n=1 Tax=Paenirhodobacter enshiensis TaxID=1105367 RepID=UPI0035B1B0C0